MTAETKILLSNPRGYQDLLDQDTRPVPAIFRERGEQDVGPREVPTEWYLSREVHEREVERIWKRCWQVACREEDLPEVGDSWVYDIVDVSLIILRTSPTEIKAYYNSCLHRGRALRDCPGRVTQLKCPFHGFTWSLEGRLIGIPSREEFPQINTEEFKLPEAKVGTWGGFVFVNMDPDSESLESFIGVLPDHFQRWPLNERTKTLHLSKVFNCNWKLAHEAFQEAFHVHTTHPQFLPTSSEEFHQADVFGNFARLILGSFIPSNYLRWKPTSQQIFNAALGSWDDEPPVAEVPDGTPLRPTVAAMFREQVRPVLGDAVESYCDAEMVDVVSYSLFPNLVPFAGFLGPFSYRFFPHGDDHEKCVMEVMVLTPKAPNTRPVPAKHQWLGDNESFMSEPGLGFMGPVLNQDTETLDHIMNGLRNNKRGKVVFSEKHELKIRHFYHIYKQVMELD